MASAQLAEPGTKYGPCVPSQGGNGVKLYCAHIDCKQTREMAAAICRICGKEIGYRTSFVQREDSHELVHWVCRLDQIGKAQEKGGGR